MSFRAQRQVRVRLGDGSDLTGRVIGADPWTDLAVVQADASGLPYAAFGDSSRLQSASWWWPSAARSVSSPR